MKDSWFFKEKVISFKEGSKGEEEVRVETTVQGKALGHRHQLNQENVGSVAEKVISRGIAPRKRKGISSRMQMLLRDRNL